ncbi:MAG: hypothetical protein Q7W02_15670 [Candidatus Rokubacteria bacterium]|nr:hypothetical protein [Candidatus Rokubacteria bacterium]
MSSREPIEIGLARGRHAKVIWRGLVDDQGFPPVGYWPIKG